MPGSIKTSTSMRNQEESSDEETEDSSLQQNKEKLKTKEVVFRLFIPQVYNGEVVKKVTCSIYDVKFARKKKIQLTASPICQNFWASNTFKHKVKQRTYTYSITTDKQKYKQQNKNHNLLETNKSVTFDTFSTLQKPDEVTTQLGIVIGKVVGIDSSILGSESNQALVNECVAIRAVLEVLRLNNQIKVLQPMIQEMLQSKKLTKKQAVICVFIHSYIWSPHPVNGVIDKLNYNSDLRVAMLKEGNECSLLIDIINSIDNTTLIQKVTDSLQYTHLATNVELKLAAKDKMRLSFINEIKSCTTGDEMKNIYDNAVNEKMYSPSIYSEIHTKLINILVTDQEVDIAFVEEIATTSSVAWKSYCQLLAVLTNHKSKAIWGVFLNVCKTKIDFTKSEDTLHYLCTQWINNGIKFYCLCKGHFKHIKLGYQYLSDLVGSRLVKGYQKVVKSCKQVLYGYCKSVPLPGLLEAVEDIEKGCDIFMEHALEKIHHKLQRLHDEKDAFKWIESLCALDMDGQPVILRINNRLTVELLTKLVSEVFMHMEKMKSPLEKVEFVVRHNRFWKALISIEGECSIQFLTSQSMENVKSRFGDHVDDILNRKITLGDYLAISQMGECDLDILFQVLARYRKNNLSRKKYTYNYECIQIVWKELGKCVTAFKNSYMNTKALLQFVHSFHLATLQTRMEDDLKFIQLIETESKRTPICEISECQIWRKYHYEEIEKFATRNVSFIGFNTFQHYIFEEMKVYKEEFANETTVLDLVTKIFAKWREDFDVFMKTHIFSAEEDTKIRDIERIFRGVKVKEELTKLSHYYNNDQCVLEDAIIIWLEKCNMCDVGDHILKLNQRCGLKTEELEKELETFKQLDNTKYMLADYWNIHSETLKIIKGLDPWTVKLVEEIASSNILISLLKDVTNDYLPDLLMCVDEFAASFMNSYTVKALINLKQYLQPLLDGLHNEHFQKWQDVMHSITDLMSDKRVCRAAPAAAEDCAKNASALKELHRRWSGSETNVKEFAKQVILTKKVKFEVSRRTVTINLVLNKEKIRHNSSTRFKLVKKLVHARASDDPSSSANEVFSDINQVKEAADMTKLELDFEQLKEYKSKVMLHKKSVADQYSDSREKDTDMYYDMYLELVKLLEKIEKVLREIHESGHIYMTDVCKEVSNNELTNVDKHESVCINKDLTTLSLELTELRKQYDKDLDFTYLVQDNDKLQQNKKEETDLAAQLKDIEETKHEYMNDTDFKNIFEELQHLNQDRLDKLDFMLLLNNLQLLEREFSQNLDNWQNDVNEYRDKCPFFKFIHGQQFTTLHQGLLSTENLHHCISIVKYIFPTLETDQIKRAHCKSAKHSPSNMAIDRCLTKIEEFLNDLAQEACQTPVDVKNVIAKKGQQPVIIRAHHTLQSVLPVIIQVFNNNLPEANEILFCQKDTSREEIEIFIQRSCVSDKLHCVANIQNLLDKQQHDLFEILQKKAAPKLVLVFKGKRQYALSKAIQTSYGMPDRDIQKILQNILDKKHRNVWTVTSEIPGLGKTEQIYSKAAELGLGVKTIHISGNIKRVQLLHKVMECNKLKHFLLHFDIKDTSDKEMIEIFLFELLVLGSVSAGPCRVHLTSNSIAIEIESTIKKSLQHGLPVTCLFRREHISAFSYDNFLVSKEPLSPIQIVAHYLDANKSDYLNSKAVHLVESMDQSIVRVLFAQKLSDIVPMNFSVINSFLQMLSRLLLQFAKNDFLKVDNLKFSFGRDVSVRKQMFESLWKICKDITGMDLPLTVRNENDEEIMLERDISMKKWEDSSHFVAMFHVNDPNSITPLFRDIQSVDRDIRELFTITQMHFGGSALHELKDYSHEQLELLFNNIMGTKSDTCKTESDADGISNDSESMKSGKISVDSVSVKSGRIDDNSVSMKSGLSEVSENVIIADDKWDDVNMVPVQDASYSYQKSMSILQSNLKEISKTYSLTVDNVLKMALIWLRVQSRVPVILMGETGCGKTTLINYLASKLNVDIEVINLHGGVTEIQLLKSVNKARNSHGKEKWIFFDEINTCEHMGILSEILCHRKLLGKALEENLAFIAACNPYKRRDENEIFSAGLKEKVNKDSLSKFVYRVHPLPESISQYVWDYGSLPPNDEKSYIVRMLGIDSLKEVLIKIPEMVEVVCQSHQFLRKEFHSQYCVSLRDVSRFRELVMWFVNMLSEKYNHRSEKYKGQEPWTREFYISAVCHSLSICYKIKLSSQEKRTEYWRRIASVIFKQSNDEQTQTLENYVLAEQEDILGRLSGLPEDIAETSCLRENVFTLFVSIFSRTPVFLLGKPGCSKSLSIHLLKKSLLGSDSQDAYFKTLPQIIVIPYQASAVSTSKGIQTVFDEAKKYVKDKSFLPVVLLDEIGLAECAPENPLKVLHNLLDKLGKPSLDLSVIGISNWALDAAKMNRAIHLSVGDLTLNDLFQVAERVCKGILGDDKKHIIENIHSALRRIVNLFYDYIEKELDTPHFYGARDFYSLVKYIANELKTQTDTGCMTEKVYEIALRGVQRNLGGLDKPAVDYFSNKLKMQEKYEKTTIDELISQNLKDNMARNLMIIYQEETMVDFVHECVQKVAGSKGALLIGSNFSADQSDSYHYAVLRQIIHCMEKGGKLILKDLERVYGSLYDMLNQNFTTRGSTNMCRIALDGNSNAGCVVHKDFRCIVMTTKGNVDLSDPPFLNRFEKQIISEGMYLSATQQGMFRKIHTWVELCSEMDPVDDKCSVSHAFTGYTKEVCQSLVANVVKIFQNNQSEEECIQTCKEKLLQTMPPDAVLRLSKSKLGTLNNLEAMQLQETFFDTSTTLKGFTHFMKEQLGNYNHAVCNRTKNLKVCVYTHSGIFVTNVTKQVTPLTECGLLETFQILKLSSISSAGEIQTKVEDFLLSVNESLLIIQVQVSYEKQHIPILRHIIDESLNSKVNTYGGSKLKQKHVCLILHIDKRSDYEEIGWQLSYFGDWDIFTVDQLSGDVEKYDVESILSSDMESILHQFHYIDISIKQNFEWALGCLRYTHGFNTRMTEQDAMELYKSDILIKFLGRQVVKKLNVSIPYSSADKFSKHNWQINEACTARGIFQDDSLFNVWRTYLERNIQIVLAYIFYQVSMESAWSCLKEAIKDQDFVETWIHLAEDVVQLKELPLQIGPQGLDVYQPVMSFKIPFCRVIFNELIGTLQNMQKDIIREEINEDHNPVEDLIGKYKHIIARCLDNTNIGTYAKENIELLIADFFNEMTVTVFYMVNEETRIEICKQCLNIAAEKRNTEELLTKTFLAFLHQERKINVLISMATHCLRFDPLPKHWFFDRSIIVKDTESFIEAACMSILPTTQNLDNELCITNWLQQTATFLSLVNQTGYSIAVAELLKLFHDMIDVIYLPLQLYEPCQRHLRILTKKAENDHYDIFMSEAFLDAAFQVFEEIQNDDDNHIDKVNQYKCLYYGRCVSNSEENGLLDKVLHDMKAMKSCNFVGTVLHQIVAQMDDTFLQLLEDSVDAVENYPHPYLKYIDQTITENESVVWNEIWCDILQKQAFSELEGLGDDDMESLVRDYFPLFHSASKLVLELPVKHNLLSIASCAFIKKYMKCFADFLLSCSYENACTMDDIFLKINKVFKDFHIYCKTPETVLYFLHCLKMGTYEELKERCIALAGKISFFEDLAWGDDVIFHCGTNPFAIDGASVSHSQKLFLNQEAHVILCNEMLLNPSTFIGDFIKIIATKYFFTRYCGQELPVGDPIHTHLEEFVADKLDMGKNAVYNPKVCKALQDLCNCLLGKREFCISLFKPQKGRSSTLYEIALFAVKMSQCILPYTTQDVHKNITISNEGITKQMWNPVISDLKKRFISSKNYSKLLDVRYMKCKRHQILTTSEHQVTANLAKPSLCDNCPWEILPHEDYVLQDLLPHCSQSVSFADNFCHLVHACSALVGSSLKKECSEEHSAEIIYIVENAWVKCKQLSGCTQRNFALFSYVLLEKTKEIFLNLGQVECDVFSKNLISTVSDVMATKEELIHKARLNMVKWRETIVEEGTIDWIIDQSCAHREHLLQNSLFRFKDEPDMFDLKAKFAFAEDPLSYNLVKIIIDMENYLKLLKSFPAIIKWIVKSQSVSHKVMLRKDAENKNTETVFDETVRDIRPYFEEFRKAWNYLLKDENWEFLNPLLQSKEKPSEMYGQIKFIDCVIQKEKYENNIIFQVIQALRKIQNTFLVKVLEFCTKRDHTVSKIFGYKDKAGIKVMPVEEISNHNVISFTWQDHWLHYSQHSQTDVCRIHYDLKTIENEIALEYLPGKYILEFSEDRFPFLIFKDDMYHPCGELLRRINHLYSPQKVLPKQVKEELDSLKLGAEVCNKFIFALEIMLSSLEEKKLSVKETLLSYVKEWFSLAVGMETYIREFEKIPDLEIHHIVSFYEYIEQNIAKQWEKSMIPDYKSELDDVALKQLQQFLKMEVVTHETFLSACKRVFVRHIVKPHPQSPHKKPSEGLHDLLCDQNVWPFITTKEKLKEIDEKLPRSLAVKHIVKTIEVVRNHAHEEEKVEISSKITEEVKQEIGNPKRKGKSKKPQFRKF